jgi:hypothetical protein
MDVFARVPELAFILAFFAGVAATLALPAFPRHPTLAIPPAAEKVSYNIDGHQHRVTATTHGPPTEMRGRSDLQ